MEERSGFDNIGVGRFAKDIATLAIPMSFVASVFGLWINVKMADFKEAISEAVTKHAIAEKEVHEHFMSRDEFNAYRLLLEERHAQERADNETQLRQIRKNTILLERIALKVGVHRQAGD